MEPLINLEGPVGKTVGRRKVVAEKVLESLPDQAVKLPDPGDDTRHMVVRVTDVLVNLMAGASGITYAGACKSIDIHEIAGLPVPFASRELLRRMKCRTRREKDAPDLMFLRKWFEARGKLPPGATI